MRSVHARRCAVLLCLCAPAAADEEPPETIEIHEQVPAEAASSVHLDAEELAGPAGGKDPTLRLFAAASPRLSAGTALVAGEFWSSDGPFANPQDFRRGNLLGKWRAPVGDGELTLSATAYAASWHASGQIP